MLFIVEFYGIEESCRRILESIEAQRHIAVGEEFDYVLLGSGFQRNRFRSVAVGERYLFGTVYSKSEEIFGSLTVFGEVAGCDGEDLTVVFFLKINYIAVIIFIDGIAFGIESRFDIIVPDG